MEWLFAVLGIIAALVLIVFGFTVYGYIRTFYSSPKRQENIHELPEGVQYEQASTRMHALIDEAAAIPCEIVSTTSYDGLKLYGRYYHSSDGAPLQILFHGYRGMALRDFCGGLKVARGSGRNTLLVDHRAHGKSEGKTICFGIREKYDVLSWVNFAVEKFGKDVEIVISGISMGAATVLEATALDLPANVKGVVADCPYSSPEEIIREVCKSIKLPTGLAVCFVKMGARLFGGLKLGGGAESAVKHAKIPILLLHGEDDRFVPLSMSRKIFEAAASEKYLYTFPDAGHGLSYITDPEGYERAVGEFLNKIL